MTDDLPPSAEPCLRPGYPPGVIEAVDEIGQPIFFDAKNQRLIRCFGPRISAFEMRNLRLEPTDLAFPGGYFLRKKF